MTTSTRLASTTTYEIDADDRLVCVGGEWAAFAAANDGSELVEPLLGGSLWDDVSGIATRQLYRRLIAGVRDSGRAVTIPCRCDGPNVIRRLELTIRQATTAGGVEFLSTTRGEWGRERVPLLDRRAGRDGAPAVMCGWCSRIRVAGDWVELSDATERLGLLEGCQPPLSHGICEPCLAGIAELR